MLAALAKARPGALSYASPGNGTAQHLYRVGPAVGPELAEVTASLAQQAHSAHGRL